jgi:hypothetical protein
VNAQKINYQPFNASAGATGFNGISTNVSLNMTTMFMILCPRLGQQLTCMPNPMYQNFQLAVGNRRFPDKPCRTFGPEFFQLQLDHSDFDSLFPCNDMFENSICVERVKDGKIIKAHTDLSNFVAGFQCERSGANDTFFDGMDSHNALVNIQLFGGPAFPVDPYFNPTNPPPVPLLFTLQETIWQFNSINGGNCVYHVSYDGAEMFNIRTVASTTAA